MNKFNNKGYSIVITVATLGIVSIIIFGVLNIHYLNHSMIRSNESSIKAYYLAESGINMLKYEIDTAFENTKKAYIHLLENQKEEKMTESDNGKCDKVNIECFKTFALKQREIQKIQNVRREEGVFSPYTEPHGWRLETIFEEEEIILYATGHYRKARKRVVSIISYPDVRKIDNNDSKSMYQFFPSEIIVYYQGYEEDKIE